MVNHIKIKSWWDDWVNQAANLLEFHHCAVHYIIQHKAHKYWNGFYVYASSCVSFEPLNQVNVGCIVHFMHWIIAGESTDRAENGEANKMRRDWIFWWCFVWWNMWIHSESVALLARNTKWQIIKTSGFTKKNIRKNINEQLKCLSNKKTCAEIRARHDFNSAEKETMFIKSFEFKLWVWDEWIEERRRLVHLFAHN